MSINSKIREILKYKEDQRQAFICKGKREAKLSLPYEKYPELIAVGGGDTSYNTTYTLDDNGRVSSITYRFPEEVASIPIIDGLGTEINIEYDNYNPTGPVPSSSYPYNYMNSSNIKRIKIGNEILTRGNFQYAYVIAPNLKIIEDVGNFCINATVGEFPELEEFRGRNFYTDTETSDINAVQFPKLRIIRRRYGTERAFTGDKVIEIILNNLEQAPTYFGGANTRLVSLPKLSTPNIPQSFMPGVLAPHFIYLGNITNVKVAQTLLPNKKVSPRLSVGPETTQACIDELIKRDFDVIVREV